MHLIYTKHIRYSVSTYFRFALMESSAREVFIFWTLVEREERGGMIKEISEHSEAIYHVL